MWDAVVLPSNPLNTAWTCIVCAVASTSTAPVPVPGDALGGDSFGPLRFAKYETTAACEEPAAPIAIAANTTRNKPRSLVTKVRMEGPPLRSDIQLLCCDAALAPGSSEYPKARCPRESIPHAPQSERRTGTAAFSNMKHERPSPLLVSLLQARDVELVHLEHRLHDPSRPCRILVLQHLAQHRGDDLPRHPVLVPEPAALVGLS